MITDPEEARRYAQWLALQNRNRISEEFRLLANEAFFKITEAIRLRYDLFGFTLISEAIIFIRQMNMEERQGELFRILTDGIAYAISVPIIHHIRLFLNMNPHDSYEIEQAYGARSKNTGWEERGKQKSPIISNPEQDKELGRDTYDTNKSLFYWGNITFNPCRMIDGENVKTKKSFKYVYAVSENRWNDDSTIHSLLVDLKLQITSKYLRNLT